MPQAQRRQTAEAVLRQRGHLHQARAAHRTAGEQLVNKRHCAVAVEGHKGSVVTGASCSADTSKKCHCAWWSVKPTRSQQTTPVPAAAAAIALQLQHNALLVGCSSFWDAV